MVGSTRTALAAKRATTTIPIVLASVFDPVAAGIVASLARQGGNITGAAMGVGGGFGGRLYQRTAGCISRLASGIVPCPSISALCMRRPSSLCWMRSVRMTRGRGHRISGKVRKLGAEWVELLKEAVPGMSRVAVLWNSANRSSAQSAEETQAAARTLSVKLDMFDAGNATNLDKAFATIGASPAQGIIVAPDPVLQC